MDDRRSPFLLAAAVRPNPSFKPSPNGGHAGHQAQGLRPILRLLSSASHRRCRLNSNVRCHKTDLAVSELYYQPRPR